MYTIYDYLKVNKNLTLEDNSWNIMDNLLCAIMVYMDVEPFKRKTKFNDLCIKILETPIPKNTWLMAPKVREIAELLLDSKRYKNMIVSDFKKILDDETQFGAVTFELGDIKVISYEGTDGTTIGWYENFRLAYQYPTITQAYGIEYANNHIVEEDTNVYLVGHSKGGNLAMAALMELGIKRKCVINAINFDGPGFMGREYRGRKFKEISNKIINIYPQGSYIGALLYNKHDVTYVKSNQKSFYIHFPTSWEVFGNTFMPVEETKLSVYLNNLTTTGFDKVNRRESGKVLEAAFKGMNKANDEHIKFSTRDLLKGLNATKRENLKAFAFIRKMILVIFLASRKRTIKASDIIENTIPLKEEHIKLELDELEKEENKQKPKKEKATKAKKEKEAKPKKEPKPEKDPKPKKESKPKKEKKIKNTKSEE